MTSVLLAASQKDQALRSAFSRILGAHFTTISTYGKKLAARCGSAEYVIADAESYRDIVCDNAIIIFKDTQQIDVKFTTETPIVAIVDSCNERLLPFVSSTELPAITCGLSPRDTVTLSSIGVDNAVINLQRSVACLDGSVAEPQEIPVHLSAKLDSFTLMAISTVFILSGQIETLLQYPI